MGALREEPLLDSLDRSRREARAAKTSLEREETSRLALEGRLEVMRQAFQLTATQADVERWQELAGKRRERAPCRFEAWLRRQSAREQALCTQAVFRSWKGEVFGREQRELWEMHVFYLHKQAEEHAAQRRRLEEKHDSVLEGLLRRSDRLCDAALLGQCLAGWAGQAAIAFGRAPSGLASGLAGPAASNSAETVAKAAALAAMTGGLGGLGASSAKVFFSAANGPVTDESP